jgi:hypothetical protein
MQNAWDISNNILWAIFAITQLIMLVMYVKLARR